MAEEIRTVPTWGYKPGESRIFELKPGDALPDGWHDTPQPEPEAPAEEPKPARKGKS